MKYKKIMEILACPKCKGDLNIKDGFLKCGKCSEKYDVKEGIPVLI